VYVIDDGVRWEKMKRDGEGKEKRIMAVYGLPIRIFQFTGWSFQIVVYKPCNLVVNEDR
jgi:hypothetical protein